MLHRALKLLRSFHQISQKDLASKLEISNSYLSGIESGGKKPGIELLEKYAEIFNMPVSSILLFSERLNEDKRKSEITRMRSKEDQYLRLFEKKRTNA